MNQRYFTLLSGMFTGGLYGNAAEVGGRRSLSFVEGDSRPDGGKWKTLTVDEIGRRLYAAHGNRIKVINLNNEMLAGTITWFCHRPAFLHGFASIGKAQRVSLVNSNTLRTTTKMKTGADSFVLSLCVKFSRIRREYHASVLCCPTKKPRFQGKFRLA